MSVTLDDTAFAHLYVPPGLLHGFQALTEQTDVCYRIDREHDPGEDLSVRYDDPSWPSTGRCPWRRSASGTSPPVRGQIWSPGMRRPEARPDREPVIGSSSTA